MAEQIDLTRLDRPEILEVVFPIVYSPLYLSHNIPFNAPDIPIYSIEVEKGIKINCAFWTNDKENPTIIYFHGNGETAADYSYVAPLYNQIRVNLFVVDYRGYGSSEGKPTISNMLGDTEKIFMQFQEIISEEGYQSSIFLMGRSLGSLPAIELALNHQEEIQGLIVESGAANNLRRMWSYLELAEKSKILGEESPFLNKVKIRQIKKPTLIIHGEYDELISVKEGEELYKNSGAENKNILIIPGAGHNNISIVNQDLYFNTIEEFIKAHS